jgi:ribonuclease Z
LLTEVQAGPYTVRGLSVGGIYTTLYVRELNAVFDVGLAPRSFATARRLFLSHAHVDHSGALTTLLGARALVGNNPSPLKVYLPTEIERELREALAIWSRLQRYELAIETVPMAPGDKAQLEGDLWLHAFKTYHPVPSLGYQVVQRVKKLRREFLGLSGSEIQRRRRNGEDLFDSLERSEIAYATDTLATVLDREPSLLRARVLILECTFLDERKSLAAARAGCHIHLDELLERAESFKNEALVLMHFSQIYTPQEVVEILDRRCPPGLRERIIPFVPARGAWPG